MSVMWRVAGSVFLAHSWYFLFPYLDTPKPEWGFLLLALGLASFHPTCSASRTEDPAFFGKRTDWIIVVLCGLLAFLGWPWSIPFLAIGIGHLMGVLGVFRPWPELARSAGRVLLIQAAIIAASFALVSFHGRFSVLERICGMALGGVGIDAHTDAGVTWMSCGSAIRRLTLTWDSSGLLTLCLIFLPLISWRGLSSRVVLGALVFWFLRLVVLLAWSSSHGASAKVLVDPAVSLLTYLPFLLAVPALQQRGDPKELERSPINLRWWPVPAYLLVGFLLCFAVTWTDPGVKEPGRVLVDDAHGSWEPGEMGGAQEDFGTDSVYNYSALWRFAGHHYDLERLTEGRITPEHLADRDVLVLKMPSFAYTKAEVEAIHSWVREGGGLIAIGDHTDVFGSSSSLNRVIAPLGLSFNLNVACLIEKRGIGNYRYRPLGVGRNPLTEPMTLGIDFMGPATIRSTDGMPDHALVGAVQALDEVDYRDGSFFGDTDPTVDDRLSPIMACASKSVEKGRVIAFSDSTVFSNFSMFEPGKPEIMGAMLAYANHTNTSVSSWKRRLLTIFPWLLVLSLFALVLMPSRAQILAGLAAGTGIILAGWLSQGLCSLDAFGWPEPHSDFMTVGYYTGPGGLDLAFPSDDRLMEQANRADEFLNLFISTVRTKGVFPRAVHDLKNLDGVDVLAFVERCPTPGTPGFENVQRKLRDGMKVVALASNHKTAPTFESILSRVGMRFRIGHMSPTGVSVPQMMNARLLMPHAPAMGGTDACDILGGKGLALRPGRLVGEWALPVLAVEGGVPELCVGQKALPIMSSTRVGKGEIVAFSGGSLFSLTAMGQPSDSLIPGDPQIQNYKVLDQILRRLKGDPSWNASMSSLAQDPVEPVETEPAGQARTLLESVRARALDGALKADITCFSQGYDKVIFTAGVCIMDVDRTELWMMGDSGHQEPRPDAPLAGLILDDANFRWFSQYAAVMQRAALDTEHPSIKNLIPENWLDWEWEYQETDKDPRLEFEGRESGAAMAAISEIVFDRVALGDRVEREGWAPVATGKRYARLTLREPRHLGGPTVGELELHVDLETHLLVAVTGTIRNRGRPGNTAWDQIVQLYRNYQAHPDPLPEQPALANPEFAVPPAGTEELMQPSSGSKR